MIGKSGAPIPIATRLASAKSSGASRSTRTTESAHKKTDPDNSRSVARSVAGGSSNATGRGGSIQDTSGTTAASSPSSTVDDGAEVDVDDDANVEVDADTEGAVEGTEGEAKSSAHALMNMMLAMSTTLTRIGRTR